MSLTDKIKSLYGGRSYDPATGTISGISSGGTGIFGTFSKQDEALFNRQMAEAQTLADIAIMEYQNEYNDPAEQAKRMRMAGLNPDIQGVDSNQSADASAAGGVSPVGSNPTEVLSNVASTAFQAFNAAQSVVSGIVSFRDAVEQVSGRQIDNVSKLDGFVTSYLVDQLQPRSAGDDLPYNSENFLLRDEVLESLVYDSNSYARNTLGFNRRNARRFTDSVYRKASSPDFVKSFYETMRDSESARQDYLGATTGDLYHDQDNMLRALLDEYIRMSNAVYKSQMRSSKYQFDYQAELYDDLSGSAYAQYQNMLNVNESSNIRSEYYEKAFGRNLRKRWYTQYKKGNILSGIGLAVLGPLGNAVGAALPMAIGMLK